MCKENNSSSNEREWLDGNKYVDNIKIIEEDHSVEKFFNLLVDSNAKLAFLAIGWIIVAIIIKCLLQRWW